MNRFLFLTLIFIFLACAQKPLSPVRIPASPPSERQLLIAAVQYPIEGKKTWTGFRSKVESYFKSARAKKADIIVFPELFTLDFWPLGSKQPERQIVEEIAQKHDRIIQLLRQLAMRNSMAVVTGSTPRLENNKLFNTSYFIDGVEGKLLKQDKLSLTPWGKKLGFSRGQKIHGFNTPWGRLVILICYDAESPQISHALIPIEPHVILVPSMTESEEGLRRVRYTSQARAVEHHAYVVVTGTVGTPEPDWKNIGQAVALNPQYPGYPPLTLEGEKNKDSLVFINLDLRKLQTTRREKKFYPAIEPVFRKAAGP